MDDESNTPDEVSPALTRAAKKTRGKRKAATTGSVALENVFALTYKSLAPDINRCEIFCKLVDLHEDPEEKKYPTMSSSRSRLGSSSSNQSSSSSSGALRSGQSPTPATRAHSAFSTPAPTTKSRTLSAAAHSSPIEFVERAPQEFVLQASPLRLLVTNWSGRSPMKNHTFFKDRVPAHLRHTLAFRQGHAAEMGITFSGVERLLGVVLASGKLSKTHHNDLLAFENWLYSQVKRTSWNAARQTIVSSSSATQVSPAGSLASPQLPSTHSTPTGTRVTRIGEEADARQLVDEGAALRLQALGLDSTQRKLVLTARVRRAELRTSASAFMTAQEEAAADTETIALALKTTTASNVTSSSNQQDQSMNQIDRSLVIGVGVAGASSSTSGASTRIPNPVSNALIATSSTASTNSSSTQASLVVQATVSTATSAQPRAHTHAGPSVTSPGDKIATVVASRQRPRVSSPGNQGTDDDDDAGSKARTAVARKTKRRKST